MTFDYTQPYASARSPVFAKNVIATSQPLATQAGIDALRKGGNACDAALAAAITLTVVEPNNNGLGSDAFALIWDGKSLQSLNASGRTPNKLDPSYFEGKTSMPQRGWPSTTIPGAVSAWVALSERLGRLPFQSLFERAIHYAREGFMVGPKTAPYWHHAAYQFRDYASFQSTFVGPDGPPNPGDFKRLPDHATSLTDIAETKGESFYRGALAEAMVRDAAAHDYPLTMDDLANHQPEWVTPISATLGSSELFEIPPNSQGLMALIALRILDRLGILDYQLDSADSIHLQAEAIRLAYDTVSRELADASSMRVTPEDLLTDRFIRTLSDQVSLERAGQPLSPLPASETVYLCAADEHGMMVSFIQSNFRGFGSGIVVPGTGIAMQNRGSGFVLKEGHPNRVAGGKRPFHTIIPGFARSGDHALAYGVMGGHMQAQGHVQMLIRIFGFGQNPQAASDAPRWHVTERGDLALENGMHPEVVTALEAKGHTLKLDQPEHLFGGAQLILQLDQGYCAASDHRKEGHAAGF